MSTFSRYLIDLPARLLEPLRVPLLLIARLWVSWQFLKSGWLKITSWENTLFLFSEEYHVPVLPPVLAAIVGTAGELVFPVLLVVGLSARIAALGLSAVNVMAVVAYAHVLLSEGFEAALGDHVLWGVVLIILAVSGPGALSLDYLLARHAAAPGRMSPAALRA